MANATEYIRLEKRLELLAWLNSLFGYKSNRELLAGVKQAAEGFDPYGRSFVYHHFVGRGDKLKIELPRLGWYDDNIRDHLAAINRHRQEPITLRYFQYLALLYAEIFLDLRFNHPRKLLQELNKFVRDWNSRQQDWESQYSIFEQSDLDKLAFWMATGSGKTLIMHINYRQFLHYNRKPLDNVLLITPNEGLSEQHLAEMTASGIPCDKFNLEESSLRFESQPVVKVTEITKLVEEKKGGGVSIPVERFEGNNLIFVDEGHKGAGGEKWRKFRDALGKTGFTFEYSATFGQALTPTRNDKLTDEYGKAIVFDYSYKYFYGDGFGKDFQILNLREETTEEKTDVLLLGNLLSFYEQQLYFERNRDRIKPYNLDKPLWVFVGGSVNAVYNRDSQRRSDVLIVARFLQHFLENRGGWVVRAINDILEGETGLNYQDGTDVFAGKFDYLRSIKQDTPVIYKDVLGRVFGSPSSGTLHMCDIRGQAGELGLKAGGAEHYFGLIYIGDTASFKKLVQEDNSGIVLEDDAIADSLFEGIGRPDSGINVLIGAKKFVEGWNSWRVSNMGLLNIGRTEGSEIIQLFGRGVRLRGRDFSLKRSRALDGAHPPNIQLIETLNIFAVRANYMAQFRNYLEREGVEVEGNIELPLEIKTDPVFLKKKLVIPRIPPGRNFADECDIVLQPDEAAQVKVDLSLKVQALQIGAAGLQELAAQSGQQREIANETLDLIDWQAVYLELLGYKEQMGFKNLVIPPEAPREILTKNNPRLYELTADEQFVKPNSFAGVAVLQETAVTILRRYVEKYYRVCQERWDTQNMEYKELDTEDDNFQNYIVRIPRSEVELIERVKQLIEEGKDLFEKDVNDLPNIHFDRHLYQPLLVEKNDKIRSDPPGLKESEKDFVENLRTYCKNNKDDEGLKGKEIFLLRNLSRGKGIGFFENEKFFPDFILWIKNGKKQRIVFLEPHGMLLEKKYERSDKARLHERLAELSKKWAEGKAELGEVMLDSYLISYTEYSKLRKHYGDGNWSKNDFAEKHILFLEDSDFPSKLFV